MRVARVLAGALVVLAGLPLAVLAAGLGTAGRIRITMLWSRVLLRAIGVRVEVRRGFTFIAGAGEPAAEGEAGPAAGTLVVANHVSWLDPLVIAASVPCRVLAKREVRRWPLIGLLAGGSGALFIDRDRLSALPGAVREVAAALAAGQSVAAFPEGTTWCGRGMGAFRPAVFQAALDAGAVVRPIALRFEVPAGGGRTRTYAAAFVGDDTLVSSVRRVIGLRGLVVEVTLLPLLAPPVANGRPPARRAYARRAYARLAEASVASATLPSAAQTERHRVPPAAGRVAPAPPVAVR
ncbi:lysophospholipid acyltransferase family protein [Thermocatellispora tengchongensis]|uniref:lysophospholipid acyltransferase family protein n=1 Tax=Thermocatellispora tengchongensis TaxID=1073253 RepID=UPI00363A0598